MRDSQECSVSHPWTDASAVLLPPSGTEKAQRLELLQIRRALDLQRQNTARSKEYLAVPVDNAVAPFQIRRRLRDSKHQRVAHEIGVASSSSMHLIDSPARRDAAERN